MKEKKHILSKVRIKRLQVQGYCEYSDTELNAYKYGIRFAYAVCAVIVFSGLLTHNTLLYIIAAGTAFLGIFPPYHPFDYVYNYVIRHAIHQPKIPPRNIQGRFACGIAAIWLSLSIYFLYQDYTITAYIFIITLLCSATLVSTTDICIPSMFYNITFLSKRKSG